MHVQAGTHGGQRKALDSPAGIIVESHLMCVLEAKLQSFGKAVPILSLSHLPSPNSYHYSYVYSLAFSHFLYH